MCKAKAPNTSKQDAEAARQAQVEQARYQQQLAAQQTEWERQRQDAEARYSQQLQTMQAEIARQNQQQQAQQAAAEALQKQQLDAQKATTARGRDYATYRDTLLGQGTDAIQKQFGQFDDTYFNNFASQFVTANRGDADRDWDRSKRSLKYKLADNRNLNSSAAADGMGELDVDHDSAINKVAAEGSKQANAYRNQVMGQKSAAMNSLLALGNTDVPGFQTDEDAASAKSRIAGAVQSMTQNLAVPGYY